MPSAQHMQMQMIHRLSAIGPGIDDYSIAVIQMQRPRQLRRHRHQMSQQRRMLRQRIRQRSDVLLRNYKQVNRRLRMDVVEGNRQRIVMNTLRRNLTGNDLAEQTVGSHAKL